jgi:protein-arginine kinase activator protein McsA
MNELQTVACERCLKKPATCHCWGVGTGVKVRFTRLCGDCSRLPAEYEGDKAKRRTANQTAYAERCFKQGVAERNKARVKAKTGLDKTARKGVK